MAQKEIALEDKEKLFKYHLINDNFDQTVKELIKIIENELKGIVNDVIK